MSTSTFKQARMEFKTTEEAKQLISAAAAACGQDLTAFSIGVLTEYAREVLGDMSIIRLSQQANRRLDELLANPPAPTKAMRELGELPDFPRHSS